MKTTHLLISYRNLIGCRLKCFSQSFGFGPESSPVGQLGFIFGAIGGAIGGGVLGWFIVFKLFRK